MPVVELANNLADQPGGSEKNLSIGQKIAGVIVSPGETMAHITARPTFWFPVLLIALGQFILLLARFPLYMQTVREEVALALQQVEGLQLTEAAVEQYVNFGAYFGLAAAPVSSMISWMVITLGFFLLLKLFKGEGSFKQYLAVTGYAYIIMGLNILLTLVVSFFTGQLYLDASLAHVSRIIAPDLHGTYLYGIIRGIDLFTVWYFAVMGIGAAAVSKTSSGKVSLVTAILFIASVLISAVNYRYL